MKIKKITGKIENIKLFNPATLLIIGFVLGILAIYLLLGQGLKYQGKTAQEWSSKYNALEVYKCTESDVKDYLKAVASAEAYKEGKSKIIDFSSMSWNAVDKCSNAFEAYQQYEKDNPQPTPTPVVQYINKEPTGRNLSSCTKQDKFYFCPDDNCYYNPNGMPTGTCYVAPPAGF